MTDAGDNLTFIIEIAGAAQRRNRSCRCCERILRSTKGNLQFPYRDGVFLVDKPFNCRPRREPIARIQMQIDDYTAAGLIAAVELVIKLPVRHDRIIRPRRHASSLTKRIRQLGEYRTKEPANTNCNFRWWPWVLIGMVYLRYRRNSCRL